MNRIVGLLVLLLFLPGCTDRHFGQAPAITAGAAGLGVDVEYIEPQSFRDPGGDEQIYFPTKFICGESEQSGRAAPAVYETLINVINLSRFQIEIGWFFVTVPNTITGAAALIPSRGSVVMDCDFIRQNLALQGIEVSPFIEGFLLIEDLTAAPAARVTAVYSVLHKQLHDLPDLRPVKTADGYCRLDDEGRLVVTIENIGEASAPESVARIAFSGASSANLTTKALVPGELVDLDPISLPGGEGTWVFTITADVDEVVQESNETNNIKTGFCTVIE